MPEKEKLKETPKATSDKETLPKLPVQQPAPKQPEGEVGGPQGPEPTRYGDWEQNGRCTDF